MASAAFTMSLTETLLTEAMATSMYFILIQAQRPERWKIVLVKGQKKMYTRSSAALLIKKKSGSTFHPFLQQTWKEEVVLSGLV